MKNVSFEVSSYYHNIMFDFFHDCLQFLRISKVLLQNQSRELMVLVSAAWFEWVRFTSGKTTRNGAVVSL